MTSRALAFASLLMIAATIASDSLAAPAIRDPEPGVSDGDVVALDFEQLLDSYATVTYRADGTTAVTPASRELSDLLEREFAAGRI